MLPFVWAQDSEPEPLDPAIQLAYEELGTIGPFGVGCIWTELEFSGTVLYKDDSRRKRPLPATAFWHHPASSAPKRLDIDVAMDGSFSGKVYVVDHLYFRTKPNGKVKERKELGSAVVVLTAPGCTDKTIAVNRRWRDKPIVMQCPNHHPVNE